MSWGVDSPGWYVERLGRWRHRNCTKVRDSDCDAYFCVEHGRWLEGKCSDPVCIFCSRRPKHPPVQRAKVLPMTGREDTA